jgi:ABC-2 type transport system permease protein
MSAAIEIAVHDLRRMFAGPLAWSALAVLQLVLGLFFFLTFLWDFGHKQALLVGAKSSVGITAYVAAPLFKTTVLLMTLLLPVLSMRTLAEERRNGTMVLLLSSPVSMSAIVLGKYLSLLAFMAMITLLVSLMPLSLALGGTLDFGLLGSAMLGLFLSLATFSAAGVYASSLTRQPGTAAIATLAILLTLWFAHTSSTGLDGSAAQVLAWLSLTRHVDALMRGVFSSSDIAYFIILITTFLIFAVRRLDALRLGE